MASYDLLERYWRQGLPVILDGGFGSELERVGYPRTRNLNDLWGTRALYEAPDMTKEVHRRYVRAGADVITTNTWTLSSFPEAEARGEVDSRLGSWRQKASEAVTLAREAIDEAGRTAECLVAFSLWEGALRIEFLCELLSSLESNLPDIFLLETLTAIPSQSELGMFERIAASGVPVWVSYRRCRDGLCGVHGEIVHRDGSDFLAAVPSLEAAGVSALLINCLPIDSIKGTLPTFRETTSLPLGVYPNVGRYINPGWSFDESITPQAYATEASTWWHNEGAQIVGGCCGVTPEIIQALVHHLRK